MHHSLRDQDILLVLAAAEVAPLPLVGKLEGRDLLGQSVRQRLAAFLILFMLLVDPELQAALDDPLLGLNQRHQSVDQRVVGLLVELGLEDVGGNPNHHRDDGRGLTAVAEIVPP